MSLAEAIQQKLAEESPRSERHELAVAAPEGGWSLHLTLDRQDELGCRAWELALVRTAAAPAGETMRTWADRIAAQVTGLLERLKVIEIDEQRNEGLLRSETPSQRKGKLSYYELLLQGTRSVTLRRYQIDAADSGKREQIAFALTHESLAKLADDLTR